MFRSQLRDHSLHSEQGRNLTNKMHKLMKITHFAHVHIEQLRNTKQEEQHSSSPSWQRCPG